MGQIQHFWVSEEDLSMFEKAIQESERLLFVKNVIVYIALYGVLKHRYGGRAQNHSLRRRG